MIQAAHRAAAAVKPLRDVLERGAFVGRGRIPVGVPVDLEHMAVGGGEPIGAAMAEIAVGPADAAAHRLDRGNATVQCVGRTYAVGHVPNAGGI